MTLTDPIANVLSNILNHEKASKNECTVKSSSIIKQVLKIMQENRYVGGFEEIESTRGNELKVNLIGGINKCGVIKPRYAAKVLDYFKFEKRYLPAKEFGILIVSTNKGIMTQTQAREKNLGGRLLAYCY